MKMKIVQCWDDGVNSDVLLIEILRRYGAKASFNLNAGIHQAERTKSWEYKGQEVCKLGWNEMRAVYEGFTIANHGLTHPHMAVLETAQLKKEIVESRDRLQQFFQQAIHGLAYPFGNYNDKVKEEVAAAGHCYARTCCYTDTPYPPADPMAFHSNCHFLSPEFWSKYEKARAGGVFYFWGHSYEMVNEQMWQDFESCIREMNEDPESEWVDLEDLFQKEKKIV